jgi:NAD(P)-dependent dehydrogenase (short-subunit alcohol dehydrogenase family)
MSDHPAVLITGASTGIGATCARLLDAGGYRVFAGVRNASDGDRLRASASDRLNPVTLDVTSSIQIGQAVERIALAVGADGLAGVINNAGIAVAGPLEYITPDDLRRQFEVNVVGLHAVTVACLPLIRRARGRIIHIGSIAGRVTSPFTGPYGASKHAVEALTDALRLELAPEGIHVAVIEPGQVRTPIWDKGMSEFATLHERMPEDGLARYGRRLNVLRWIVERAPRHGSPPEQVAAAVLHALQAEEPRTRYVVGRDAGIRLWLSRILPTRVMDALVLRTLAKFERRLA